MLQAYAQALLELATGEGEPPLASLRACARALEALCDDALRQMVALLEPEWVVGVGLWSRTSAERALAGTNVRFGQLLHPSPANPAAKRGWAPQAEKKLRDLGILD